MKDLDFDELDKAVNSLMSGVKKEGATPVSDNDPAHNAPSRDEPGIPLTAAPIVPGATKPKSAAATNPDAQPAITPQVQPATSSRPVTPATRRNGRFMDLVPKKPNTPSTPSRPISRQGTAITPRPDAEPASSASANLPDSSVSSLSTTPLETPTKPEVTEKTAPSNDWPDPIEMAGASKAPTAPNDDQTAQPHDQKSSNEQPKDQPLSSPFLPDAKVEKRPLGSVAPIIPDTVDSQAKPEIDQPDDTAAQLPAQPEAVSPEVPAEFGGDVMQVEADTHMGVPKTDDHNPVATNHQAEAESAPLDEPVAVQEDKRDTPVSKPPSPAKVTDKAEEVTSSEPSASGRISIPQQYKEQPPTGEKESGAIYDTSTYHQPLAHPAKKKSGWLWVVWIVLILLIGAGAGAGLYFLGVM
jgi:hypothetical protein